MQGEVANFGIADVYQLLGRSGKSGLLTFYSDDDEVCVIFLRGMIIGAEINERPSEAELGSRLRRAGLLTRSQLGSVLRRRAETDKGVGDILLELGYASEETITRYATLQNMETLYELFTWGSGTYKFEEQPVDADEHRWCEPLNAEFLLVNGIRLHSEWPMVRDRISSYRLRIVQVRDLPPEQELDDDFFGLDKKTSETDEPEEILSEIGENERLVYDLCGLPESTVQLVIDRAPLDRFETLRCVCVLMDWRFIRLDEPTQAQKAG
jgi:hypothetical protein